MLDPVFEPAAFECLDAAFPDPAFFENSREIMDGRFNLMRGNPEFDRLLEQSDDWAGLFAQMNGEDFALALAEHFRPEIERKADALDPARFRFVDWYEEPRSDSTGDTVAPPPLPRDANENSLFLNLDIARAVPGYNRGPHTDARHKLAVMLVFFTDHPPDEGAQFQLYDYLGDDDPPPRAASEGDVELVREVRPKPNRGIIFPNSQTAYHAVTRFRKEFGVRRFLYASVASVACEDVWDSDGVDYART